MPLFECSVCGAKEDGLAFCHNRDSGKKVVDDGIWMDSPHLILEVSTMGNQVDYSNIVGKSKYDLRFNGLLYTYEWGVIADYAKSIGIEINSGEDLGQVLSLSGNRIGGLRVRYASVFHEYHSWVPSDYNFNQQWNPQARQRKFCSDRGFNYDRFATHLAYQNRLWDGGYGIGMYASLDEPEMPARGFISGFPFAVQSYRKHVARHTHRCLQIKCRLCGALISQEYTTMPWEGGEFDELPDYSSGGIERAVIEARRKQEAEAKAEKKKWEDIRRKAEIEGLYMPRTKVTVNQPSSVGPAIAGGILGAGLMALLL